MATELIQATQSVFLETSRERPPRDGLRRRIGCAVVESVLGIKVTPIHTTMSDRNPYVRDSIDAAIGLPVRHSPEDYVPSIENENSSTTGLITAHANYLALQAFQLPGLLSEKERAWRNQEKYTVRETDRRLTRIRKSIGRNALVVAGGVAFGSAVGAYGALLYDRMSTAFDNDLVARMDSATGIRTTEVNLTALTTDIYVGGHTDGTSGGVSYLSGGAGIYNPNAHNVQIQYSAQMGMLTGDQIPMNVSDTEAANQVVQNTDCANGAPVRIIAFSQGTEGTLRALNQLAAQNGGTVPSNVTVILEGTPSGDRGLGINPLVHTVDPMLNAMGIETTQPIPPGAHIIVRTDIADVFGDGGNQSALKLAEMAVGPGHRVVGPENGVLISSYNKGGVTYEIWGDPNGINDPMMRALRDSGVPVTPQAEALAKALVPYTPPGAHGPVYANGADVASKIGPAIDSYMGNKGVATRTTNAVLSDPAMRNDLNNILGAQPIVDQINDAIQHPVNAPQDIKAVRVEATNAINSALSYAKNPNKVVNAINRGLEANGIPGFVPQIKAPAHAPIYHAPVSGAIQKPLQNLFSGGGNQSRPLLNMLNKFMKQH